MTLRQGKSLLGTYAVLMASQLGNDIVVVGEDELVKRLEANEFMVFDELQWLNLKPESRSDDKKRSKGEKKRQRSEWNRNIYNSRKGLQRG